MQPGPPALPPKWAIGVHIFSTKPRHRTWLVVGQVVSYLRDQPDHQFLSLKDLTLKLVTLAALVSADRGQTLSLLNPKLVSFTGGKATFFVIRRLKTSKPRKGVKRTVQPAFPQDRRLCVRLLGREYVRRMEAFRRLPRAPRRKGATRTLNPRRTISFWPIRNLTCR